MGALMETLYPGMEEIWQFTGIPRRYVYGCKLCVKRMMESNEIFYKVFTYPARLTPHQLDDQVHEKIAKHLKEEHSIDNYKKEDFKLYFGVGKE